MDDKHNVVDGNAAIYLEDVMRVINAEVQWCYQNMQGYHPEYRLGFVRGLIQANTLMLAMAKKTAFITDKGR